MASYRRGGIGFTGVLALLLACGGGSGDGGGSGEEGSTAATSDGTASSITEPTADSSGGLPPEPVSTVAELLVPFDVNLQDLEGPPSWATQYGKPPEIIAVAHDTTIDVLAQDYTNPMGPGRAVLVRLESTGTDYVITRVLEPPVLDRVMGLARDPNDALYIASGAAEDSEITLEYPAVGEYRQGVVRVVKQQWDGAIAFDTDLDTARETVSDEPEQVINPMVAATSRLAYGAGFVALVHGINTDPDDQGIRHQKALTTHLHSGTGEVTRVSSVWVSHSFDQRLFHDGTGFVEMHLGDAYPRDIVLARVEPDSGPYPVLHIKGETGANNTFTRLGNVAQIEGDASYGYLALFATEPTASTEPVDGGTIAGSRELGVVRIMRNFDTVQSGQHLDPALPDAFDVQSGGEGRQNRLRWLTDYQDQSAGQIHAARPKLVGVGGDTYVVLWERWEGGGATFTGTWGMVIDAMGETLVPAAMLTDTHLPRGDDALRVGDEAGWVTGDSMARQLHVHLVDATLAYRRIIVE